MSIFNETENVCFQTLYHFHVSYYKSFTHLFKGKKEILRYRKTKITQLTTIQYGELPFQSRTCDAKPNIVYTQQLQHKMSTPLFTEELKLLFIILKIKHFSSWQRGRDPVQWILRNFEKLLVFWKETTVLPHLKSRLVTPTLNQILPSWYHSEE